MQDHHLYYPIHKKMEDFLFGEENIDEDSDGIWDIIKAPVIFLVICVLLCCIFGHLNNLCKIRISRSSLAKPNKDDVPLEEVANSLPENIV